MRRLELTVSAIVFGLTICSAGCDEETAEMDAGMDAGEVDLDAPAENCDMRCADMLAACSAPPAVAASRCPLICGATPTERELMCLEGLECPALMGGIFSGNHESCDFTHPTPDAGSMMMMDAGPPDAGTDEDAGATGDAGVADGGAGDGGAADAGDIMCVDRCTAKLVSCGSPDESAARTRCMSLCDSSTTESDVACFEAASCMDIVSAIMTGGTVPCLGE